MTCSRGIIQRLRTAALLLSGVVPLSLQAGPVVGGAMAARQVDRLLKNLPSGSELPQELVLQVHLISLVSDVVTLRGDRVQKSNVGAGHVSHTRFKHPLHPNRLAIGWGPGRDQVVAPAPFSLSKAEPQGP